MIKYFALAAIALTAACSESDSGVEPATLPTQELDLERPSPDASCADAADPRACLARAGCRWMECPPTADCQQPAWCETVPAQGCGPGDSYDLPRKGAEVVVGQAYRACEQDADCTLVAIGCDGCCQQDAIAYALETTFQENFRAACAGYSGAICDCSVPPAEAHCVSGLCRHILIEQ